MNPMTQILSDPEHVAPDVDGTDGLRLQARALAASANAIVITDREGRIEWVNPAFTTFTGYTADEVQGRNPRLLKSGAQDETFYADLWETILAGDVWHGTLINKRKDGGLYWEEQTITPVEDDGTIEHFIAVKQDVTDRVQAEQDLRKSQKRWRNLVEHQRDGIFILVDGEIRYANAAGVRILGAPDADAVIGRPVTDFMATDDDRERVRQRADAIRNGQAVDREEFEVQPLSGQPRIVESYAVPIAFDGERAAQATVRDVTEDRRTQKQLQQAQKMETVGELAGGLAHDFNNILHAAKVYLQMTLEDLSPDEPAHDFVTEAEDGLGRAEALVRKLLTFSRPSEEQRTLKSVDPARVVQNALDLVAPSLPKTVTVRTAFDTTETVEGDPGQLHQVATNILTNAGQAMEDVPSGDSGHMIDVDVRGLTVDDDLARRHLGLDPGRYVRLSISDTGPGMDAVTRDRIFDPFFTTKDTGKGTGLGLSVVHGIVRGHGGDIVVYTEPGEGTTFDVYLPSDEDAPAESSTAPRPRGTALFVDDDEPIAELEALRLRRLGYAVTTCATAEEALEVFDRRPDAFDLVVTDHVMPGMNGLDLARTLRDRGFDGPILLMSGFSAQVSPDEAIAEGVTAYLRKPVGGDELKKAIDDLET